MYSSCVLPIHLVNKWKIIFWKCSWNDFFPVSVLRPTIKRIMESTLFRQLYLFVGNQFVRRKKLTTDLAATNHDWQNLYWKRPPLHLSLSICAVGLEKWISHGIRTENAIKWKWNGFISAFVIIIDLLWVPPINRTRDLFTFHLLFNIVRFHSLRLLF